MLKNFKKAITLLELLLVIAVIGILALMTVPRYMRGMENARDREIESLLRLIATTERVYRREKSTFIPCIDTANCRDALLIELRSQDWNYFVNAADDVFTAIAVRTGGPDPGRRWEMDQDDDHPSCVAGSLCP